MVGVATDRIAGGTRQAGEALSRLDAADSASIRTEVSIGSFGRWDNSRRPLESRDGQSRFRLYSGEVVWGVHSTPTGALRGLGGRIGRVNDTRTSQPTAI